MADEACGCAVEMRANHVRTCSRHGWCSRPALAYEGLKSTWIEGVQQQWDEPSGSSFLISLLALLSWRQLLADICVRRDSAGGMSDFYCPPWVSGLKLWSLVFRFDGCCTDFHNRALKKSGCNSDADSLQRWETPRQKRLQQAMATSSLKDGFY